NFLYDEKDDDLGPRDTHGWYGVLYIRPALRLFGAPCIGTLASRNHATPHVLGAAFTGCAAQSSYQVCRTAFSAFVVEHRPAMGWAEYHGLVLYYAGGGHGA